MLTLIALKKLDNTPPWDWPDETGAALLEVLRSRAAGEEERLLATKLAGDSVVIDEALVGALLSILQSGEELETVRSRAAISLGPVLELCDSDGFEDADSVPITERTFHEIQESMRTVHLDAAVPKEVRRRNLEASVRAPLGWHEDAIRAAYASDDEEWRLTAVFCMRYMRGFDQQILASLESEDPDIHVEAVQVAGAWAIGAAWPHVVDLVTAEDTDRRLLLAAITAVGSIRPQEASEVLEHLQDSDDAEIAEAVLEATAGGEWDADDEDLKDDEPGSGSRR